MLRFSSSPPFSVDQKLLLRWLRATAIIAVPALASLASSLQSGEPISLWVLVGTLVASFVDFIRRYVTDYSVSASWDQRR